MYYINFINILLKLFSNLAKIEDGIGEKVGIFLFFFATFVLGILLALIKGWELALICLICLPLSTVSMGFVAWVN